MGEMTAKQSRDGLDYANDVAALALKAPHLISKKVVLRAVDALRKFYGFSDDQKRALIFKSIEHGCRTYREIAADTLLHKDDVNRLVKDMELHGELDIQTLSQNDRGRPTAYIQLTGRSDRNKITEK